MKLENNTVENNHNLDVWHTAPKTDTELLRVLYNWRAYLDREAVEQLREKNSEIERLQAEIYRLKALLNNKKEVIEEKESEAERQAFNMYNLYSWIEKEASKEKCSLNVFVGNISDYLTSLGVEETSLNIAKVRAIAKDLLVLYRTEAEEKGIDRSYNLLQDIRTGKDFITVKFNDDVYDSILKEE